MAAAAKRSTFPTGADQAHDYDDDGYPISRSHIPSNAPGGALRSAEHAEAPAEVPDDVDIVARPIDETNSRIRADRIVADIKRSGWP